MNASAMLEIAILKVENPSCLWGRIVKCPGIETKSQEYVDLQVQMNLFYHEVNQDVPKIKPSSLEEGQVCVVYSAACKSWCRAIVESLFLNTVGSQAMCFLVDYGERITVSSDEVRAPLEKFLQLPFWVRKYHLAGIHPMRLQVSICEEKAVLIPSKQWDSSATRYLHNLLQASAQMEAVMLETLPESTAIELYLTVKNVKICVNDDLISKTFACSLNEKTHSGTQNGFVDRPPAILACDIFTDTDNFLATDGCTVRSLSSDFEVPGKSGRWESEASGNILERKENERRPPPIGGKEKRSKSCYKQTPKTPQRKTEMKAGEENREEDTDIAITEAVSKKLNLFRFLKFLNTASSTKIGILESNIDGEKEDNDVTEITGKFKEGELLSEARQAIKETAVCNGGNQPGRPAVQLLDSDPYAGQLNGIEPSEPVGEPIQNCSEKKTIEEEMACARLLQLLNPDPLKLDTDSSEVPIIIKSNPIRSGVVVHSSLSVDPCTSLANAPITDTFRRVLQRRKYRGPSMAEGYCWPAVARGCDTVLISNSGDDPLTYLPPFLAHMQLSSVFCALSSHTGPIAVILCPGWEKAQIVFDLLEESQATQALHPAMVLVGVGANEAKAVKIPNNCQVLVTTPFSLVRLLGSHCFLFLRLCHLVLDEVDMLLSRAREQTTIILQHYQKVTVNKEWASCTRQIIAVGKHWSNHMESLLLDYMNNPCVIVTAMEEAALYGNVHQMVLLCLDCTKISVLLGTLDLNPDTAQKTLIIANSVEEVEHVFKAVSKTSAFSLKAHEKLTYQFDFVFEQWRKDIGPGTHVILVTTNDCLKALGIRDATCVVHYGFPFSPKLFGSRLSCMSENFRNLSDKERAKKSGQPAKSVLLLSERNARHVTGVLRYLKRAEASLPPELLHFADGVLQAKEQQKTNRNLCTYLKSFGFCRDGSSVCLDRHSICPTLDQPLHPDSGTIVVLPLYIKTASRYFGRIVNRTEDCYKSLAVEMATYYATEKLPAKDLVEGRLYGVQEEEAYHRVQLTWVPELGEHLFFSVKVYFLDEGREQEVKAHQLLQLPPQFHSLPPQALEIIVCRVKPIEAEVDWNPKVTRVISQKIRGLQHQAKVVLSLGNTIFVDPMVRMTRLPGLKTFINEYNVQAEILNTGMGISHPEHLDLLKELCQRASPVSVMEPNQKTGLAGAEMTLEDKVQSAEQSLICRMSVPEQTQGCDQKVSEDQPPIPQRQGPEEPQPQPHRDLPAAAPAFVPSPTPQDTQPESEQWNSLIANLKFAAQTLRNTDMKGFCPGHPAGEKGQSIVGQKVNREHVVSVDKVTSLNGASKMDLNNSFHPQVKWFQREDRVILNVKLTNPEAQSCEFFPERVVYIARVKDRPYRVDLELHLPIAADRCSWEMKCNEPIITLMKRGRVDWKMLLKQKNNFVSLDFDHFEEDEREIPNGHCFTEHTGEDGCYVSSDSDSD